MDFRDTCAERWRMMRVKERRELLEKLRESMEYYPALWKEEPIEVLANLPDFDILPSDLCGHLILALDKSGFSVEKFNSRMKNFKVRASF